MMAFEQVMMPNQALEATADGALDLPTATRLLTSSVGGASVLRSASNTH
jgi:hypothetical protein